MNHIKGKYLLMNNNYLFLHEPKIIINFQKVYSIHKTTSAITNRYNYLFNNHFYFRCGMSLCGGIYYGILSSLIGYYMNKYMDQIGLTTYLRNKFWYNK